MNKKAKKNTLQVENVLFYGLWSVFLTALAGYLYFTMTSVVQTVLREELQISIQETETRISELDAVYFEKTKKISRENAEEYGLVAISPSAYIEVGSQGGRITRND